MDMTGCDDFARRGLEFFLKRYNDQGFLTTGYTLVGTGENLWTIAEYQARCGNRSGSTRSRRSWFGRASGSSLSGRRPRDSMPTATTCPSTA